MVSLKGIFLLFMFGYSQESIIGHLNGSCEHSTFCETVPHYPTDLVNIALEKNPHLRYLSYSEECGVSSLELTEDFPFGRCQFPGTDSEPIVSTASAHGTGSIKLDQSTRHEEGPEEEALCLSIEEVVFPKFGLTKNKQWKYIVNHASLKQSVHIEICLEEDKPCHVIDGFAAGYVTSCKQKYIYHQLFAMGPNGTINRESFRFPASCCCRVEFQGDRFLKSIPSGD
ncbi:spaetzle domain-containing protein isoform X1 [Megalopta genalis]|uniref:spaetzle domain-containing protein isoform X1 n=1 Tax=Megalopta genalis TaxID=115081 RepID=UPI003FD1A5FF